MSEGGFPRNRVQRYFMLVSESVACGLIHLWVCSCVSFYMTMVCLIPFVWVWPVEADVLAVLPNNILVSICVCVCGLLRGCDEVVSRKGFMLVFFLFAEWEHFLLSILFI